MALSPTAVCGGGALPDGAGPHAAAERGLKQGAFRPGAQTGDRTDDLLADLLGADASVQIKKHEPHAARRERAAFKVGAIAERLFDGFGKIPPRRGGIEREKIKHMGSMSGAEYYM